MWPSEPTLAQAFVTVAAAVVVIAVLWVTPGVLVRTPHCPSSLRQNGIFYCSETLDLPMWAIPPIINNTTSREFLNGSNLSVGLAGVGFVLHSESIPGPPHVVYRAMAVAGTVTPPNGTAISLTLLTWPTGWVNWTSWDRAIVVDWQTFYCSPTVCTSSFNVTVGVAVPLLGL